MARKGRPSSCNTYGIMCGEPTIIIDNNLVFTLKTFDAILHKIENRKIIFDYWQ